MINLLVISDTHGSCENVETVIERQFIIGEKYRPTHLVYLGDGIEDIEKCEIAKRLCVHMVKGNCDSVFYSESTPNDRVIELYGYKIFMTHGHTYSVKYSDSQVIKQSLKYEADILLYGHTHVPISYTLKKDDFRQDLVLKKSLTVFNPGSLKYSGTFGVISLSDKGILCSHGTLN